MVLLYITPLLYPYSLMFAARTLPSAPWHCRCLHSDLAPIMSHWGETPTWPEQSPELHFPPMPRTLSVHTPQGRIVPSWGRLPGACMNPLQTFILSYVTEHALF